MPRPLAWRLDRLARAAHRFHRFAHHPLCAEYSAELIRVGRRGWLCRGCTLALAGLAVGVGVGLGLARSDAIGTWALGLVIAVGCIARVVPPRVVRRPHEKMLTRFLPAAGLALAFTEGLRWGGAAGLSQAGLALGLAALVLLRYRARGPDRSPCRRCPERQQLGFCRGFMAIGQRERAFQRLAGRLIQAELVLKPAARQDVSAANHSGR